MERGRDFSDIVYTLLVVEKLRSIEDVAEALGMSYAALHARLINRTCFSADEIRRLIVEIGDARLVAYFLDGSKFIPADRPHHAMDDADLDGTTDRNIKTQRAATRVVIEATDVLEIVDAGLAGQHIDHRVARVALAALEETESALATLRVILTAQR